jgi:predicted nucleic acid-binding protein
MAFILDNSVASGWFLENKASPYTEAIAARLNDDTAHAPALWELELANVLRTACLRQRMTADQAQSVIADLGALPIEVDRTPARPSEILAMPRTWSWRCACSCRSRPRTARCAMQQSHRGSAS